MSVIEYKFEQYKSLGPIIESKEKRMKKRKKEVEKERQKERKKLKGRKKAS